MEQYLNYLIKWLINKTKKANANGVIVALSGGIDSAVVAKLAKLAFPNNSMALIIPIEEMLDIEDAILVAKDINISYKIINLSDSYKQFLNNFNNSLNKWSISNLKPRLRMLTLYTYSQSYNYLVLGTSNYSEYYLGYFTKYGDGAADLYPIINLRKDKVYQLAKLLKINNKIIEKKPSAGLWQNQSDEQELGFSYFELENYFKNKPIANKTKLLIEKWHNQTKHKRNSLIKPKKYKELS